MKKMSMDRKSVPREAARQAGSYEDIKHVF